MPLWRRCFRRWGLHRLDQATLTSGACCTWCASVLRVARHETKSTSRFAASRDDASSPPTLSQRQLPNARSLALTTPQREQGTAASPRVRRRREVHERRLSAFLHCITNSTNVLQQQWTTALLEFNGTFKATAVRIGERKDTMRFMDARRFIPVAEKR